MTELELSRIALVVARRQVNERVHDVAVATGYFLTKNLVLTVRHVGDLADSFAVRADIDGSEKDRWSDAKSVWSGVGDDVDAMLLRTTTQFVEGWKPPTFKAISGSVNWKSSGYSRITDDDETGNRKTLPLSGSVGLSLGQGPPKLALQTSFDIAPNWESYWKGISGAPIFLGGANDQLIGIITEANRALSNGLIGLPATRFFDEIHFRSHIAPSFLGELPTKPWCLVVTSEGARSGLKVGESPVLMNRVAARLTAFKKDEEIRFQELDKTPFEIPVLEAIRSVENWAATVDALARADYLIADVTSFEPAVMLLVGIRSVLRRGVTISVTANDLVSHASKIPFNVQETKMLLYKSKHFHDDLRRAMSDGAANLAKDSNYLDLPAYHAVRAPRPETWAEDDKENLLILCPFSSEYSARYNEEFLSLIRAYTGDMTPSRMLDLRSPRLVGQALYEQIRWSSHCMVDWTEWSPNVFFELGVRLACSEHDPVCVIDQTELGEKLTRVKPLKQHAMLDALFEPVKYDRNNPYDAFERALEPFRKIVDLGPPGPRRARSGTWSWCVLPLGGTFSVAQASFQWQYDPMLTRPDIEQRERAEQIVGKDQHRQPERLILFANNKLFDAELNAAVREKWIAAWLYLQHLSTAKTANQDAIRTELMRVSQLVLLNLQSSDDDRHSNLREEINKLVRGRRAERGARGSIDDHG